MTVEINGLSEPTETTVVDDNYRPIGGYESREAMITRHDDLVEKYNETGYPAILEEICVLEIALLHSPLRPDSEEWDLEC